MEISLHECGQHFLLRKMMSRKQVDQRFLFPIDETSSALAQSDPSQKIVELILALES